MSFKVETVGFLEVNCYLIPSKKDNCVYIIDPGASPDKIANTAKSFGYNDFRILLTHAHIDHISAIKELMELLPVSQLYLHPDDMMLYKSPANELLPIFPRVIDPVDPLHEIESEDFEIIHTPGHTRGGVCFYFKGMDTLFSGDTLFCSSIGRTDFPGGDMSTLLASIKDNLFVLPENIKVYPGHGAPTSIADEKENNPFFCDN